MIAESIGAPKLSIGGGLGRYRSTTRSSASNTLPTTTKYRPRSTDRPFRSRAYAGKQAPHGKTVPAMAAIAGRQSYRCVTCSSDDVTRQTVLPTSSAINSAPDLSMATPTGRPRASLLLFRKPVTTSCAMPLGWPLLNGT
jgi:hypothetical protein